MNKRKQRKTNEQNKKKKIRQAWILGACPGEIS